MQSGLRKETRATMPPSKNTHKIHPRSPKEPKRPRVTTRYKTIVKVNAARTLRTHVPVEAPQTYDVIACSGLESVLMLLLRLTPKKRFAHSHFEHTLKGGSVQQD